MSVFSLHWMDPPPEPLWGGAVSVGNFDGVHRGHQLLIRRAKHWANQLGGPTVAVTFDPPPVALLHPHALKLPLSTLEQRAEWLHDAGADHIVLLQSDASLLSLSPEAFFEDVLLRFFRAKAIVEGTNFCFGRGRAGDTKLLGELCQQAGIGFEEVQPLFEGTEPISSSRVRAELQAGAVDQAATLLGRFYRVIGPVVTGAQRGRTLGFPTANLGPVAATLPGDGVYAVRTFLNGTAYAGAANVGPAPTFGENARKVEVHLLDFQGDLYGQLLPVEFVQKLRDTRPFPGLEALQEQLQKDISAARTVLKAIS